MEELSHGDIEENGETTTMLNGSQKQQPKIAIIDGTFQKTDKKNRKESLRDFIKELGSVGSLPGTQGKPFSTSQGMFNQILAALAVFVLSASAGQPIGISAVLLPQLYKENSTLHADLELGSWIASVHSMATPVGSFLAGPLMERLGRLRCLQLSVFPLIIGWIVMATAPNIPVIFVGRILCGYSVGSMAAASQVYLGEIADPKLRGLLSGAPYVNYSLGILFIYAMGELPWRWIAASGTILPVISLLLFLRAPETPDWLVRNGRLTKAHNAIMWLRGDATLARKEIHQIVTANVKERERQALKKEGFWKTITKPSVMKPLVIINIFNVFQILSGTFIIVFYAVDIIEDAAGATIDSLLAAIATAVLRLIFCVIGCFLLYRMNKRTVCMMSGIGSTIACFALGVFLLCKSDEKTTQDFWITAALLIFYIATNTVGFMMMPGIMVGELLPAKVRGMCGGYIFMLVNIVLFGITKLYPFMKYSIGVSGLFIVFGVASLLGTIFLYLVLPETKNKSLIQIQEYFEKSNFLWIAREKTITESPRV